MRSDVRTLLGGSTWRYALPAGLVSSWLVLTGAGHPPEYLDFGVVALAGLLGGVLVGGGTDRARRVGFQTGLVGSFPAVLQFGSVATSIPGFDQPAWFGVVQGMLVLGTAVTVMLLVGLSGAVGAVVGDRLTRRFGPAERDPASS